MERERTRKRPRLAWDVAPPTVPEVGFFRFANSGWIRVSYWSVYAQLLHRSL